MQNKTSAMRIHAYNMAKQTLEKFEDIFLQLFFITRLYNDNRKSLPVATLYVR